MTEIKGKDPIQHKTQPHEQPAKKRNLGRGVLWAMIGVGVAILVYFIMITVIAGSSNV
jgi:hypothetical protein